MPYILIRVRQITLKKLVTSKFLLKQHILVTANKIVYFRTSYKLCV